MNYEHGQIEGAPGWRTTSDCSDIIPQNWTAPGSAIGSASQEVIKQKPSGLVAATDLACLMEREMNYEHGQIEGAPGWRTTSARLSPRCSPKIIAGSTPSASKSPAACFSEPGPVELFLDAAKGFVANLALRAQVVQRFALGSDRAQPQLVIFGRSLRLVVYLLSCSRTYSSRLVGLLPMPRSS
jgi:hypothetical protein